MTSTTIYTPITPTYLYIKQHSITKKKYFGKTTRDPYTYNGSGPYWVRHIKKHGKEHIVTLWVSELYHDTSIVEVALKFSADNDIVNSKEWANMKPENGLDGGSQKGRKLGPYKKSGKPRKPHKPHKPRSDKGNIRSEKTKAKLRKPRSKPRSDKGKPRKPLSKEAKVNMRKSEEQKANQSVRQTGKKHKPHKPHKPQPQVTCPHCGKSGGGSNMKRYHFDNCKAKKTLNIINC